MGFYWIFWASLAQLHYPSSLGFMGLPSIPYFLCFHYFGLAAAHSHFSTSYTAHGLLFLSFRTPLSPFTSSRSICLFHEPVIYHSCYLSLMVLLHVCQPFAALVAGLSAFHLDPKKWPTTIISFANKDLNLHWSRKCKIGYRHPFNKKLWSLFYT